MEDMMSPTTLHETPVIPVEAREPLLDLAAIFALHLSPDEMRELAVSHDQPLYTRMADVMAGAAVALNDATWTASGFQCPPM
jgi:hypothetical protein